MTRTRRLARHVLHLPSLRVLSAFACLVTAFGSAAAVEIRIAEPAESDLLYGPTRIVAEVDDTRDVVEVAFFLDAFRQPLCRVKATPFVCEFDAGKAFQGRTIRVVALGRGRKELASVTVHTLAFPKPERVVRHTLEVPVIASTAGDAAPDLAAMSLECRYGGEPCRVVSAAKLSERQRYPVSLEILVDVSGSLEFRRDQLAKAVEEIIENATVSVEVSLVEFAELRIRLSDFTVDKATLREGLQRMSGAEGKTCFYRAVRKSLETLRVRGGHKALFVISDGYDTCQRYPNKKAGLSDIMQVDGIVNEARRSGARIYIFDMAEIGYAGSSIDGLARETGGRLFAIGELHGLVPALEDLRDDLVNTWVVDLDLPATVVPAPNERLILEAPDESGVELRFPLYWLPQSRTELALELLQSIDAATRAWAATELEGTADRDTLRALVRALQDETADETIDAMLRTIRSAVALLMLHGDRDDRRVALSVAEKVSRSHPLFLDALGPALRVFSKVEDDGRVVRRANALLGRK